MRYFFYDVIFRPTSTYTGNTTLGVNEDVIMCSRGKRGELETQVPFLFIERNYVSCKRYVLYDALGFGMDLRSHS